MSSSNSKNPAPIHSLVNAQPIDKTSHTDDERIKDITVLPPPEHLIRFFPISGTPVEELITNTRRSISGIMHGRDDRLLVIMGPVSYTHLTLPTNREV